MIGQDSKKEIREIARKLLADGYFQLHAQSPLSDLLAQVLEQVDPSGNSTSDLYELILHPAFEDSFLSLSLEELAREPESDKPSEPANPWLAMAEWFENGGASEQRHLAKYRFHFAAQSLVWGILEFGADEQALQAEHLNPREQLELTLRITALLRKQHSLLHLGTPIDEETYFRFKQECLRILECFDRLRSAKDLSLMSAA